MRRCARKSETGGSCRQECRTECIGQLSDPDMGPRYVEQGAKHAFTNPAATDNGEIVAEVDFLGEGTRHSSGRMSNFRRGVTRYPIPGALV